MCAGRGGRGVVAGPGAWGASTRPPSEARRGRRAWHIPPSGPSLSGRSERRSLLWRATIPAVPSGRGRLAVSLLEGRRSAQPEKRGRRGGKVSANAPGGLAVPAVEVEAGAEGEGEGEGRATTRQTGAGRPALDPDRQRRQWTMRGTRAGRCPAPIPGDARPTRAGSVADCLDCQLVRSRVADSQVHTNASVAVRQ